MCHETWTNREGQPGPDEVGGIALSDGTVMPAWTYRAAQPGATCIVLPDIYGPSPFYHHVTAQLAAAGYDATLLDYFVREGALGQRSRESAFARRAQMNENTCLADISAAIDILTGGDVNCKGLVGFCLSGTFAWDITTMRTDLATVSFYGFPEGPGGSTKSDAPRPIDIAAWMSGPVLSFWGDRDHIPMPLIETFGAELAKHDVDYRHQIYPDVGHGFLQGLVEQGDTSAAAQDAWQQTLDFFTTHLKCQ